MKNGISLRMLMSLQFFRQHFLSWLLISFSFLFLTLLLSGIVVTNDGNAILRELDIAHPAAKARSLSLSLSLSLLIYDIVWHKFLFYCFLHLLLFYFFCLSPY
jgi:hypothetical protein